MRLRPGGVLIWCAVILLVAMVLWVCFQRPDRPEKLAWIQTAELAEHFRPGIFTTLKFRILRLPGPFWRLYMSGRTQVVIETRLLAISPEAIQPTALLPSQFYTNADGAHAWILSPEEFRSVNRQIHMFSEYYSVVHAFKLTTMDGGQAQLNDGAPRIVGGNSEFIGMRVDLLPTISKHSFKLKVGAIATESAAFSDGPLAGVMTNLAAGCAVQVANGGAVIVQAPANHVFPLTNYWLMVAPVAVDARGNLKKLLNKTDRPASRSPFF